MDSLTIMIPAFNEEDNIRQELDKVCAHLQDKPFPWEIVVVNDGSKDRTRQIVAAYGQSEPCVRLVDHKINQGVGAAIHTGLTHATMDWAFLHPADGQFDIRDIDNFLVQRGNADIIVGYKKEAHKGWHRRFLTNINLGLTNLFFQLYLRNVSWVTLYRLKLIREMDIQMRSPIITTEILVRAKKRGARLVEVETNVWERQGGKPSAARLSQILKSVKELLGLKILVGRD